MIIAEVDTRHWSFTAIYPPGTAREQIERDFLRISRKHIKQCGVDYDEDFWRECAADLVMNPIRTCMWQRDGEEI